MSGQDFYKDRPCNEAERVAVLSWLDKEREFDEHNATEFNNMDRSYLNKTRTNGFIASIKRNKTENTRAIKNMKTARVYIHNEPRAWLKGE